MQPAPEAMEHSSHTLRITLSMANKYTLSAFTKTDLEKK